MRGRKSGPTYAGETTKVRLFPNVRLSHPARAWLLNLRFLLRRERLLDL